ncbi:peptidase family M48-domain-containing protein, partial [Lasiosphaeria ovina]
DPDGSRRRQAETLLPRHRVVRFVRSPITHGFVLACIGAALAFYFANLETVPVSGRTRFNAYSAKTVRETADLQYRAMLADLQRQGARFLPDHDPRTRRVKRVMRKLIPFSGMGDDEHWEIFVIEDPKTANAFVLPGGKVFVFSGILNVARSDSAVATVLGHEIAHNVAGHVGERMSQQIGTNILLYASVIALAPFGILPVLTGALVNRVLDVVFSHPMSRKQETEADYIGLMMMAEACYDPEEAPAFWARMEAAAGDSQPPEWLSTHPSNETRIKKIQGWLPAALEKRAASDCYTTSAFADRFKRALSLGIV